MTRYFGGTKLGAGGLVRAYSSAVSTAIKDLKTKEYLIKEQLSITLPYSFLDTLKHQLNTTRTKIISENYSDVIELILEFPETDKQELLNILEQLGQGKIIYSDED